TGRARPRSLTVLIPAHDTAAHIEPTLQCLLAQRLPPDLEAEVIVLVNTSRYRTLEIVHEVVHGTRGDALRFRIENLAFQGRAHALNRGLGLSRANCHLVLAPDVIF